VTGTSTFTEVQILNGTTGAQDQISQFVANETIPVTVGVGSTAANYTTNNDAFTVSLTPGSGSLEIIVTGQNVIGPRIVLVSMSKDSFLNVQGGYLQVSLDNATIPEAPSLEAVLTGAGSPSYILIGTSSGFELLVSIPHFSTHTILITTPVEVVQTASASSTSVTSSSGTPTSYIVGAIVVFVAVVLIAAFAVRSQRSKKMSVGSSASITEGPGK